MPPFAPSASGTSLGSRGSVIPTFQRQIAAGGPVTVTDPHMTRYFMSVEEAVQLVLQSSVLAERGDIYMLEMGEPISILDLAHRMIRLSGLQPGLDIRIRITGPRIGEKLHEQLHTLHRGPSPDIAPLDPSSTSPQIDTSEKFNIGVSRAGPGRGRSQRGPSPSDPLRLGDRAHSRRERRSERRQGAGADRFRGRQ